MPSRFLHTRTYTNTNFCFGTDPWHRPTVYVDQYTSDTSPAALAAKARRQGAPSGNEGFSKEEQKARLQRTNFIVGNDELKRTTSYYHSYMTSQPKPTPCHPAPPPERSQFFPRPGDSLYAHSKNACSSNQVDFNYYSPQTSDDIYAHRYDRLQNIKGIHTRNSVGASLQNRPERTLTFTKKDYEEPWARVGNSIQCRVTGNNIAQNADSIWKSVNSGHSSVGRSEAQQNFSWNLAELSPVRRFVRGRMNKVR